MDGCGYADHDGTDPEGCLCENYGICVGESTFSCRCARGHFGFLCRFPIYENNYSAWLAIRIIFCVSWGALFVGSGIQLFRLWKADHNLTLQLIAHIMILVGALSRVIWFAVDPYAIEFAHPMLDYQFGGLLFYFILYLVSIVLYNWASILSALQKKQYRFSNFLKGVVGVAAFLIPVGIVTDVLWGLQCNDAQRTAAFALNVLSLGIFFFIGIIFCVVGLMVFFEMRNIVKASKVGRRNLYKMFALMICVTVGIVCIIALIGVELGVTIPSALRFLVLDITVIELFNLGIAVAFLFVLKQRPKRQAETMTTEGPSRGTKTMRRRSTSRGTGSRGSSNRLSRSTATRDTDDN